MYMLQEVHCTGNTNQVWSAQWGYQAIFSNYKSNKAGVCILFNNNFDFQIEKVFIDPQGRFIICDIKTNENCLTLANIYALLMKTIQLSSLISLITLQTLKAMTLS